MANNNNLTPKQIILVILVVLGIPFFITLFVTNNYNNNNIQGIALTNDSITTIDNSKFEILESNSNISQDNIYIIKGKVKQKEDESFTGIGITFTMYDENNNKVRETTSNISNYLGNGIWEFEAYGNDADNIVTSYKLETIYGY